MTDYYKAEDLPRFAENAEGNKELAERFFAYYNAVFEGGASLVHGVQMLNQVQKTGM